MWRKKGGRHGHATLYLLYHFKLDVIILPPLSPKALFFWWVMTVTRWKVMDMDVGKRREQTEGKLVIVYVS